MTRNLLVVYYSQTGQLKEIALNFVKSFERFYNIDFAEIKCKNYNFPITYKQFFDVFPESVLKIPCDIEVEIPDKEYQLVVLAFQPWFLHTSVPFNSFMQTERFKNLVKGKQVILLMNSRNSWRNSLQEVTEVVESQHATIRGKYVFRDTSKNFRGFLALCYWLFTGKKKSPYKWMPQGGIEQNIMDKIELLGKGAYMYFCSGDPCYIIIPSLKKNEFTSLEYEQYAIAKYKKWANFIAKNNFKHRNAKLALFRVWILFMLTFVAPLFSKANKRKKKK